MGTLFATPPQPSSSAFCIAIQRPIMTSMTVSMDCAAQGPQQTRSQTAPATAPATMASGIARKKFTEASASAANAA